MKIYRVIFVMFFTLTAVGYLNHGNVRSEVISNGGNVMLRINF